MSTFVAIALAAALPYMTGTAKECEHFYPNDQEMRQQCSAPIPPDTAGKEGLVFVSAKFMHNGKEASCEGFNEKPPA